MPQMLTLDEALERVLARALPLSTEVVSLRNAAGRVLAEDLVAPDDLPRFDHSAMDGYAVCTRDCSGETPFRLRVVGESRAGHATSALEPRSACRIFTGAPLPEGADAVVIQENVEREGEDALIRSDVRAGDHIRRRGEDLSRGSLALARGARLGPYQLGLAAALDRSELEVARKPQLCILCTGDELRLPGDPARSGSLPESNSVAIAALAESVGAEVLAIELVGDDRQKLEQSLSRLAARSDVLVTVGGASVGDHDLVRQALSSAGGSLDFWKVKIKPGKPLLFGTLGRALVLGLPGNPVSAQLNFTLFGLPLLRTMQGEPARGPRFERARLSSDLTQKPGRLGLYRARLDGDAVVPEKNQASGSVLSLGRADALVLVPAESEGYQAGSMVDIIRLSPS
jgi:molybdopterin molybdotransferase